MTFLEHVVAMRAAEQLESATLKPAISGASKPDELRPFWKAHLGADGCCNAWGCRRKIRLRGLCDTHYYHARRLGVIDWKHRPHPRKDAP